MANTLSEQKKQQILALGRLGWSLRRIERETGVRRETASTYLKAANIPVGPRRGPQAKAAKTITDSGSDTSAGGVPSKAAKTITEEAKAAKTITDPAFGRTLSASACEPYRELIEAGVRDGRQAMSIWQDLVSRHGFTARYSSVQRFVLKLRSVTGAVQHPVIITAPGEECQVDYGDGPMARHPVTGKYQRIRMFALVLGHSRKTIWLLTWRSSSKIWSELHEKAFRRLGGTPKIVVLDNLREGVIKPDVYDPEINPLYRDVLAHYGVVALPCRVRDPNRKGKVESAVKHAQQKVKGLRFESLDAAQKYLDEWSDRWADKRIHGTTKIQVSAAFEAERPHLQQLPTRPFRYYEYGTRVVSRTGFVEVCSAYYGVPPGKVHEKVRVQWTDIHVRVLDYDTWQLLREHTRQPAGGRRIEPQDESKRVHKPTTQLIEGARKIGPNTARLCEQIYEADGEVPGAQRIRGTLRLVNEHGHAKVERACKFALESQFPNYRFVKRYLEQLPGPELTLRQIDPLIRNLNEYRDLIEQRG